MKKKQVQQNASGDLQIQNEQQRLYTRNINA